MIEENKRKNEELTPNPEELITDSQLNSALGCIIGAFIGDSLVSAIEFQRTVSDSDLKKALSINGGFSVTAQAK